jgi:hypothetical protein
MEEPHILTRGQLKLATGIGNPIARIACKTSQTPASLLGKSWVRQVILDFLKPKLLILLAPPRGIEPLFQP